MNSGKKNMLDKNEAQNCKNPSKINQNNLDLFLKIE